MFEISKIRTIKTSNNSASETLRQRKMYINTVPCCKIQPTYFRGTRGGGFIHCFSELWYQYCWMWCLIYRPFNGTLTIHCHAVVTTRIWRFSAKNKVDYEGRDTRLPKRRRLFQTTGRTAVFPVAFRDRGKVRLGYLGLVVVSGFSTNGLPFSWIIWYAPVCNENTSITSKGSP